MTDHSSQPIDTPVVARDDAIRPVIAAGRTAEPSGLRLAAVFGGSFVLVGLAFLVARALAVAPFSAPGSAWVTLSSVVLGVAVTLLIGSIVEWTVHRWIMHRPTRLPGLRLAYEHHHRAHHWINFPPDQYIQAGPVQYVPLWGVRLDQVATSRLAWAITVASHFSFYGVFALPTAVLPAWWWTGNTAFAGSVTLTAVVLLIMFVHVHDAMHYPGLSPTLERMAFFRWLDHHHYIHHVDTGANTNFLLPLGDVLLGTWRRELTDAERRRWPSYEDARQRLVTPRFTAEGVRVRSNKVALPT